MREAEGLWVEANAKITGDLNAFLKAVQILLHLRKITMGPWSSMVRGEAA